MFITYIYFIFMMGSVYESKDFTRKYKKKISNESIKDIIPSTNDSVDEDDKEKE